jgi:hypothetical protein
LTATTGTVAPTTVPLSCASGGVCAVGDTGPGGGIVFYVHPGGGTFASPGSDCGASCRYLEVAPRASQEVIPWARGSNEAVSTTSGAIATGIGNGYQNTVNIKNQTGNDAYTSAAVYAFEYSNNGKTDWHLPSKVELNELCKYARSQTTGNTSVACANTGSLRERFSAASFWSSSEYSATQVWGQYFGNGSQYEFPKTTTLPVRPVRAF